MWRLTRGTVAAFGAGVLLLVAGCDQEQTGVAVKSVGSPPTDRVDVELLVTGTFPTDPLPALGLAGSASDGALIDARRMADNVVGPWEVDPALMVPGANRAIVLKDAASVGVIEPSVVADAARTHDIINGFASDRQDSAQGRLVNAVLRFADPQSAAAAATDMANASRSPQATAGAAAVAVPIPDHADAQATAVSYSLDTGADQPVTVYSFTPHGAYVLAQIAHGPALDATTTLITHTLDLQGPRIDQFVPTDPAEFAGLAVDPTGLLAHTMTTPMWPGERPAPPNPNVGVYLPRGALHFQDDPAEVSPALSTAGVKAVSYHNSTVFQAHDPTAAAQLADSVAVIAATVRAATPISGVDFMPASHCMQAQESPTASGSEVFCFASVGPFAFEVHSGDPTSAREQTAAQYKILLAR